MTADDATWHPVIVTDLEPILGRVNAKDWPRRSRAVGGGGSNQICIIYSRTFSIVGRGDKEKSLDHYPVELAQGKETRISDFGVGRYLHIFNRTIQRLSATWSAIIRELVFESGDFQKIVIESLDFESDLDLIVLLI